MRKFFYYWRFYSFGREQYQECMNNVFNNNLLSLRMSNVIISIFAFFFAFFPIIFEQQNFLKAGIYVGVSIIALVVHYYANFLMQQINVNNRIIHLLTVLSYTNVIVFGVYLDIWGNPNSIAAIFPCFMVCALLMFINSPRLNFFLILSAMFVYMISAILFKPPNYAIFYIVNSFVAGILSLFLTWHITKLRLGLELSTIKLEEERNKYVDQSMTDELTQLKNRRDFMQTFQRYLSNYRSSDDWLCVAIADIDFFKNYNDHYGHPQGDECLRNIGKALASLNSAGVYAARVGGEEFALLWFVKDPAHVDKIVIKWTEAIKNLTIQHEKSKISAYVTMSIGVYIVRCGSHHDKQELYDLADKALYTAKKSGRNCTIICGDEIKQYKITPP